MGACLRRFFLLLLLLCCGAASNLWSQALPSVGVLVRDVQAHQQLLDKTRESYTFRESQVMRQTDKHGAVKKEETREFNVFYVNGHPIRRLVRKDNRALSADEESKEADHIKGKIGEAQNTPPEDPLNTRRQVSISRLLAIQRFSNERRLSMDNRPMIVLDFEGDRSVQTHGMAEDASKHLAGTIWIDEQDKEVRRVEARLDSPFRLEMGLVSLSQGSSFSFDQKIVNGEVWLPTSATVHIEAKAALFLGYHIQVNITDDQYHKFKTAAEQQAGSSVEPGPDKP
ncbi:hypothetical protein [Acidipila sp. EB88]|uniref:hypothetical protein n=1 Tax=Acidipila sp. EB88 TaxID=2305226 RepID=UPI000F5EB7AD|nr:hypothetical protein [Acidipila sp. EB88]RRA47736.1 hypothetical protein D1Y84_04925 [Acidipila sp. EB88]